MVDCVDRPQFMSCDGVVAIMGNGNQDTQSWCHSQEVNVMIDSPQIVGDWMDQLRSNQNTHIVRGAFVTKH